MRRSPGPSCGDEKMYPGIRLSKAPAAIQDQKGERIIRIVAVRCQQGPTLVTLHRNEMQWRIARMPLQPPRPASAEVAESIKNDYPILPFHILSLRDFTCLHTCGAQRLGQRRARV